MAAASASDEPAVRRPASKRLLVAVLGVGTLAAVALVLALVQGGGGAPFVPTRVSQAAYVTTREPGYKVAMTVSESAGGQTQSLTATGSFSIGPPAEGSMSLLGPNGIAINEIVVSPDVYIQLPPGAGAALAPTPWVKTTLNAAASGSGFNVSTTGESDPSQELNFLRGAGEVTNVGNEDVRGVPTTHYHAVVDLNRYASAVAPSLRAAAQQNATLFEHLTGESTLPLEVWIDLHDLVRRVQLDLSVGSGAGPVTVTVAMDFYDYGRQPAVSAPPASQVTDVTSTLASQAASAAAQLGG